MCEGRVYANDKSGACAKEKAMKGGTAKREITVGITRTRKALSCWCSFHVLTRLEVSTSASWLTFVFISTIFKK